MTNQSSGEKGRRCFRGNSGYCCPACGKSATEIEKTMSFEKHIVRKRRCLLCNHVHETQELFVDSYAVLATVHSLSIAHMQGK